MPAHQYKYGIYEPNCGIEDVHMSFGHDGYIANVMEPYLRNESLYTAYQWSRFMEADRTIA